MHRTIVANEGMVLTNGDTYGRRIHLGEGDSPENWREITFEEYEEIIAQEVVIE